jgi:hypothetical protein
MCFVHFNCICSSLEASLCAGKIHLVQSGGSDVSKSLDELSKFGSDISFFLYDDSYISCSPSVRFELHDSAVL